MEMYSVIDKLLRSDPFRMIVLEQVRSLSLPDCWVAAGFIRNMVWDSLHDYSNSPNNDVDVIFYDSGDRKGGLRGRTSPIHPRSSLNRTH